MNLASEEDYLKAYYPIYHRKVLGCFKVFGVQDAFMLDLSGIQMEKLLDGEDSSTDHDKVLSRRVRFLGNFKNHYF